MISLPLGMFVLFGVLSFALADNLRTVFNVHSIILVFAGTIGVLGLATPWPQIAGMFRALLDLRLPSEGTVLANQSLLNLAKKRDAQVPKDSHPLILYAQDLWEQGVERDVFRVLLAQRLEESNQGTEQAVATLRNLAKYPPALGMTGTVIGLVSLFSGLTPDKRSQIGPSLALAMTATFYGLVLANAVLMPLADRLHLVHLSRMKLNDHVFHVLLLIHQGEPVPVVEGGLRGAA